MSRPPSAKVLATLLLGAAAVHVAFHLGGVEGARPGSERRRTPVVEAVHQAAPAVVSVHADMLTQGRVWKRGAGSGVILDPAGFVITNSHVIQGAHRLTVELFRGGGRYGATVVLNDPGRDLALLRIEREGGFPYAVLAESREVLLGETAIAIGNPRGLGDTITVGVVSALDREARMTNGVVLRNLIQTDAPINTGSSGGALLNLDGEVLGVIVSLLPSASCIAFAIPADDVRALLERVIGRAPPSGGAAPPPAPAEEALPPPAVADAPADLGM
jgi:serine protease Do